MLNRLAEFQQSQLEDKLVSLVMITSLDVGTFKPITRESKRPVLSVPLPQLTDEDDLAACRRVLEERYLYEVGADEEFSIRARIAFAVSATGGHFRMLEEVMSHNYRESDLPKFTIGEGGDKGTAVLTLLMRLLPDPSVAMDEAAKFGSLSLLQLANSHMVVFEKVVPDEECLVVRIVPSALFRVGSCAEGLEQERKLVDGLMRRVRVSHVLELEKLWERAIPMAMALRARAFLRAGIVPTLEQVLPSARVNLHVGHTALYATTLDRFKCGVFKEVVNFNGVTKEQLMEPGCLVATVQNQSGIELSVTSFEAARERGTNCLIPFFFQMKMWKTAAPGKIEKWIAGVRKVAETKGFAKDEYYVVICVSQNPRSDPKPGEIFITADACSALLEPYGASPMKQLIEQKAGK